MSTYSVKVRTLTSDEPHHITQLAFSSGEAYEAVAARFGYLCNVVVYPQ